MTSRQRRGLIGAEQALLAGYRRDSSHVGSVYLLGVVYEEMGNHESAGLWYQRAVELWPSFGLYHARLARMLHLLKRDQAARQHFNQALALDPRDEVILVWAGYFYLDMNDPEQARSLFESALAVNPANRYARLGLDGISVQP
jgi:tetratricopeptide (TPR) repeat protein